MVPTDSDGLPLSSARHPDAHGGLARLEPMFALAYLPAMRLTPEQQSALRDALRRSFGTGARLWLFGSRVDDRARGGDYDLMVQSDDADAMHLVDARLGFLAELHATPAFEDERLDVVLYAPALDPQPRPIHCVALAQGIELT